VFLLNSRRSEFCAAIFKWYFLFLSYEVNLPSSFKKVKPHFSILYLVTGVGFSTIYIFLLFYLTNK
jgi:hypothetical protein